VSAAWAIARRAVGLPALLRDSLDRDDVELTVVCIGEQAKKLLSVS
jgi:hypothetical protein